MVQPVDFGAVIRSGQQLVPDYAQQLMRERLMGVQEKQVEAQQQQAKTSAAQETRLMAAQTRENDRLNAFQAEALAEIENPTTAGIARLLARYPEFSDEARRIGGLRAEERNTTNQAQLSQAFAAIRNGSLPMAIEVIETRRAADAAAGRPTSDEDELLRMLRSDNPRDHLRARGMIGMELANLMGPDNFSAALGRLSGPDAEQYAESLGLTPGTDDWDEAIRDFVLRGEGPTAQAHDVRMEGVRHGYRTEEEAQEQAGEESLEDRRERNRRTRPPDPETPSEGNVIGRIQEKLARGDSLTPGEQRVYDEYLRGRGSRGRGRQGGGAQPSVREGTIVRNPQTGQRMQYRRGQWHPVP